MVSITSDGANKLIKSLEEEKNMLLQDISSLSTFVAAITEDPESVRPEFDFKKTVEQINVIDNKLIKIKNARSAFNTNMKLKSGLSISEALIRMAMLNRYLFDCKTLAGRYPKTRSAGSNKTEIEYRYINYDLQYAKDLYKNVSEEIMEIQKELNIINSSEVFDVDINL